MRSNLDCLRVFRHNREAPSAASQQTVLLIRHTFDHQAVLSETRGTGHDVLNEESEQSCHDIQWPLQLSLYIARDGLQLAEQDASFQR